MIITSNIILPPIESVNFSDLCEPVEAVSLLDLCEPVELTLFVGSAWLVFTLIIVITPITSIIVFMWSRIKRLFGGKRKPKSNDPFRCFNCGQPLVGNGLEKCECKKSKKFCPVCGTFKWGWHSCYDEDCPH